MKRIGLARTAFCRIEQLCGCGRVVEISVGPLSFRIQQRALSQLRDAIDEALRALDSQREDTALLLGRGPRGAA